MIQFEQSFLKDNNSPIMWQITKGNNASVNEVYAWLSEHKPEVNQILNKHSGILLRGFHKLTTAADFEQVVSAITANLMDYIGGASPRKVVQGKIMTASEIPANYSIPLHQEMSYTSNPPERIAFFCQVQPTSGGHTTVGDMRTITQRIDPVVRERFKQKQGVQLRRNLPTQDNIDKIPGVLKSWAEVLNTTDRIEAQDIADKRGWKIEWLSDESMHLWQEILPATKKHPVTGDEVWFNQAHMFAPAACLKWARKDGLFDLVQRLEIAIKMYPELLDQVFYGDGTPVDNEDVLHIFDVLDDSAIPIYWHSSDVLILDNILAAHGRTAFNGKRMILTALIDHQ
ncbi:TauD/TfdA family dioxygenase [Nostoc sp. CHAB 5824]|nr:TauD/TfdA family dioxygenase [Nostoc sp. CHAB 5824]